MKKFKFPLDSVLSYKQQILESLQIEHAEIMGQVRAQEERLAGCWRRYREYGQEYRQRSGEGMAVTDALIYQSGLRAMERQIQQETAKLETLREKEEAKRNEVVEAKTDTSSIEKLREKKLTAYHKEEAKREELLIEEFVTTTRLSAAEG